MRGGRHGGWCGVPAAAGSAVLLAAGCGGDQSSLAPAGPAAERLAELWWTIFALLGAVTLVVLVLVALAFRARRDDGGAARDRLERRLIVGGGIALPLAVATVLMGLNVATGAAVGGHSGKPLTVGEPEIRVLGHRFWWEARYRNGAVTANELHIPVGRPVTLELGSVDVIHSFWVPRLHGKIDMTPGHATYLTLEADRPGVYRGQCAEFCGLQHALMAFLIVAEPEADYRAWLAREASPAAEPADERQERGLAVFMRECAACHALRGTEADGDVGPDLTHLASRRSLGAGTVVNNRGNLGGWIVNAQSIKPGNPMPPIPLGSDDLLTLLEYLESLE